MEKEKGNEQQHDAPEVLVYHPIVIPIVPSFGGNRHTERDVRVVNLYTVLLDKPITRTFDITINRNCTHSEEELTRVAIISSAKIRVFHIGSLCSADIGAYILDKGNDLESGNMRKVFYLLAVIDNIRKSIKTTKY